MKTTILECGVKLGRGLTTRKADPMTRANRRAGPATVIKYREGVVSEMLVEPGARDPEVILNERKGV